MNAVTMIIFMGIVGSFIGGLTNILAIKMLFRPYEAKYLFGRRLPFTPGVIPRRRDEASGKLGDIIIGHLLTPDVFIKKIESPETRNFIMLFIDKQIDTIENEKLTPRYFLERLNEGLSHKIAYSFNREIEDKVSSEGDKLYHRKIHELIPPDALKTIDVKVEALQPQAMMKVEEYLGSEKGYSDLYTMTDEFIENRGKLARSIKYIMSKESIVESIQSELIKLIHHPKMTVIQNRIIEDEYTRIKSYELSELLSEKDRDRLLESVSGILKERINIDAILDRPIAEFNPEMFESFKERGRYSLLDNIVEYLGRNTGRIFEKLHLAQVIKKQIDSFELSYIEKLVLEIADKEFKMIKVLGFVLGGIIGVFQGIIVAFL